MSVTFRLKHKQLHIRDVLLPGARFNILLRRESITPEEVVLKIDQLELF